jgi:hypothetical protein
VLGQVAKMTSSHTIRPDDYSGNIGLKVYPNILLLDFEKAVEQSKILSKSLGISHFDRKYNTNVQTLESDLRAASDRFV